MNLTTNELINLKYMMKVLSIATWLMLLILAGCSDASPYAEEPSAQERTITLNLDITTRADDLLPDGSEPDIIRIWIFDENNKFITCVVSSQNVWTRVENTDAEGNKIDIRTTLQTEIEAKNIDVNQSFKIFLLLNQPYTDDGKGSTAPVDFSDVNTLEMLKKKTFVLTQYAGDNKVPMTGEGPAKFLSVEGNKIIFDASINATRCVAKLGIYCTKGNPSPSSTLTINQVTLSKVPDKGYLFEPDSYASIEYTGTKTLLSQAKTIDCAYIDEMPGYSDVFLDETKENSFVEISSSYLLENLNGKTDNGFLQLNGQVSPEDKRYCITLSYTLNGVGYTQNIYVSQIKRNQYSKIYIRINDAITIDTYCQVNSWTEHTMDVPPFE